MSAPSYTGPGGADLWTIIEAMDAQIAATDSLPFQRNASSSDVWSRSVLPLSPTDATPDGHLEYNLAVRSHSPTGEAESTRTAVMFEAAVDVVFAFRAYHDDQWLSYRLAMQAAQLLRNRLLSCHWHAATGFQALRVFCSESFSPAALPVEEAGLLITQSYRVRHLEGIQT
tara:strand:+ start:1981 stop:2493 length:513 start_codon:yes stop_codon:yes gene_type:complete